jgi:putative selenate reductase
LADFTPIPLSVLITRLFRELGARKSAFNLARWKFARAPEGRDLSIPIFGRKAATPFGPAAGPHTQLAQNIVLAWLAGGRVIELKTVQLLDHLEIARPCIDMETVGYNIEWSQELSLEQSLEEYVKAAMLIEMLKADGLAPGLDDTVIDMSAGYDLAGIRSAKMAAFFAGMKDASAIIERLRAEIPAPYARFRDLAYPTRISDSITLSTFHGCPPGEIEAIAAHLLDEVGLDVIVKLNPTLIGRERLNEILHDRLGYDELRVPDATFDKDAKWDEVVAMVGRLADRAEALGRGFGVKFTNTLLVENHRDFFPESATEMYLSGPPLHVLAIELVDRFRKAFGDRMPVSFSAGIDVGNFADAVALGLRPVSACSDLLKGAGYGKGCDYIADLGDRMAEVGATDIDGFILGAFGEAEPALADIAIAPDRAAACRAALKNGGDLRAAAGDAYPAWVSAAKVRNTATYAARVRDDRRYTRAATAHPPAKSGAALAMIDCETCGKCVGVCPNAAIFRYALPKEPIADLRVEPGTPPVVVAGTARPIRMNQQIGIFADACNTCGNCDVTCPETGAPYARKAVVFGSVESLTKSDRDGFVLTRVAGGSRITARLDGDIVSIERTDEHFHTSGPGFSLDLADKAGAPVVTGTADRPVDLGRLVLLARIADAITSPEAHNFASAALN